MKLAEQYDIPYGSAICYSGYREGQSPVNHSYPSYEEVAEDLRILQEHWKYLRIYDSGKHADLVLEVIRNESLDFKVMLGADVAAELKNPGCPWGADHPVATLEANRLANDRQMERMIELANEYSDSVVAVSIGNEASVDWTDHLVAVERLIGFAQKMKQSVKQPVTFCENYVPWTEKLAPLVAEVDFISLHTYPVWEYHSIETALEYTKQNFNSVAERYPDKPVIITEAGWTTHSNGRGIDTGNASQELQAEYYQQLIQWSQEQGVLTFVFEAFDEPWKGSEDPYEPEKHWGLFTLERKPKLVMQALYSHL